MRVVDRIDLTAQPSSCLEHPLVKLKKLVDTLGAGDAVEVFTSDDVVPLKTIEIIARKGSARVEVVESSERFHRLILVKSG